MKLGPNGRLALAFALLPVGLPALVLWGVGWALMSGGQELWMVVHRVCRAPNCTCGECREFDPEFVKRHQQQSALEPPAAA